MKQKYKKGNKVKFYWIDKLITGTVENDGEKVCGEYLYIVRPQKCKYRFLMSESELKDKEYKEHCETNN